MEYTVGMCDGLKMRGRGNGKPLNRCVTQSEKVRSISQLVQFLATSQGLSNVFLRVCFLFAQWICHFVASVASTNRLSPLLTDKNGISHNTVVKEKQRADSAGNISFLGRCPEKTTSINDVIPKTCLL